MGWGIVSLPRASRAVPGRTRGMMPSAEHPLVTIIGERCRMCYACIRECPARAIQVVDGQASVIQERCIGCGNCLRVCSQNAKHVRDDTVKTYELLDSRVRTAAIVAPSFPAEFADIEPGWRTNTSNCSKETRPAGTSLPRARQCIRTSASTVLTWSGSSHRSPRPWWRTRAPCGTTWART
jgi:ferredoxin